MIPEYEEPIAKSNTSGSRLRRARESLGLSAEDVAGELRLSVSQIKALEQDDYTDLPGATYVRGYLRSYARLVKVDEDSVLPPLQPEPLARSMNAIARPVQRQARSSDRWVRLMSYSLGLLLIALVVVWWRSQGGFDFEKELLAELPSLTVEKGDSDRTVADSSPRQEATIRITAATAEAETKQSPSRLTEPDGPAANMRTTTTTADQPNALPQRERVTPPAVLTRASRESQAALASQSGRIVLTFSQSSWAEIRDASNERLLHQSFHPGREVAVEGTPPFSVFLGNAGGVRMEYNGETFDITPHQTGLYARFVVPGN